MDDRYYGERSRPNLGASGPLEYDSGMLSWEFVGSRMRGAVNYLDRQHRRGRKAPRGARLGRLAG